MSQPLTIVSMYNGDMHFAKESHFNTAGFITLVGKTAHFRKIPDNKKQGPGIVVADTEVRVIGLKEVRMVDVIDYKNLDVGLQDMYTKVFMSGIVLPGNPSII